MDEPSDRHDPDETADERTTLLQFLDYHRATLRWKVAGLTKEQLATRVAASDLTLAGLVKHLALVEDSWFQRVFLGLDLPEPWRGVDFAADSDWEFRTALDDDPADLLALYAAACDRSRAAVASAQSLDALAVRPRHGSHVSLRWILVHMIEETARHNGHADLLREAIDGATGE